MPWPPAVTGVPGPDGGAARARGRPAYPCEGTMFRFLNGSLLIGLTFAVVGCGAADREELAKTRVELQEARAELAKLQAAQQTAKGPRVPGYVEELGRLEAPRAKGGLTKDELEA